MSERELPRVVCVDDEARIVEGLVLHLRKDYEVHTALSGDEALKVLKKIGGAAVVVSDMRMPGMDGASLLHRVMSHYPDATRILLTGDPGRDAAAAAVNQGQIFRFLTKPCPPDQLQAAVESGVMQHRLVNAERSILKETLIGCIKALTDVLAITNPVAFGRANRVKRLAVELADTLDCRHFWQLEAAAMLSQLGYLSLPQTLVEKLYCGEQLTAAEKALAAGVPDVTSSLLENIPRLEPVIQILVAQNWSDEQVARLGDGSVGLGTRILGLTLEFDALTTQGHAPEIAIQSLRRRAARFGADLLEHFAQQLGAGTGLAEALELPLRSVTVGMVIMQDVRTHLGTLLVPRGYEVTSAFLERVANFGPEMLSESVKVTVPAVRGAAAGA
ncbi:MAG TPA: HD domain-containing phosphohydrolase [Steroidobacteraceae bacterium]|nr:HD domain-containing phosphohydrolase [Steroidobacteraceae bacterium]